MSSPSSVDAFRDPSIKLFGRDIHGPSESFSSMQQDDGDEGIDANKDLLSSNAGSKGLVLSEKVKFHIQDPLQMDPGSLEANTTMKEDGIIHHGKSLKKPDKLLPCPRCESLDTKFCYFNNYNVNQPRHFCRKCQRYWTAGGMLRNVPVGAGRRKNKHSHAHSTTSHEKNTVVVVVDTRFVREDAGDMACHRSMAKPNQSGELQAQIHVNPLDVGPVLSLDSPSRVRSFGEENVVCAAAATTLATDVATEGVHAMFADGKEGKEGKSGRETVQPVVWSHVSHTQAPKPEKKLATLGPARLGGDFEGEAECERSNGDVQEPKHPPPSMMPYMASYRGPHNGAFDEGVAPNFWPPLGLWAGIPWPLMSPLMWNSPSNNACQMPYGVENAWNMFYGVKENALPKQHKVEPEDRSQPNGCLWAPKTLRIADPVDAARSSIWSTLGLGAPSSASSPSFGSKPKAFRVKPDDEDMAITPPMPHSNPAALSRSAAFNENS